MPLDLIAIPGWNDLIVNGNNTGGLNSSLWLFCYNIYYVGSDSTLITLLQLNITPPFLSVLSIALPELSNQELGITYYI